MFRAMGGQKSWCKSSRGLVKPSGGPDICLSPGGPCNAYARCHDIYCRVECTQVITPVTGTLADTQPGLAESIVGGGDALPAEQTTVPMLGSLKTGPTGPPGPYQIGLHLKLNSIRNPTSGDAQLFFQHFAHFCAFLHTFFCVFSHIFGSFFNFF